MRNITLIVALIGISMNTQAHGVLDSSKFESTPIPVVSNNIGRLHGYTIPFAQSVEAGSKGQYADANQFGRITAYGNAINKKHDISEGIYARIGEYGRLSGYSRPKIIYDQTNIVSR